MTEQELEKAVAEIWQLFKETDARLAEHIKGTDARLAEQYRMTSAMLAEHIKGTDARLAEQYRMTSAMLTEQHRKTEEELRKTDAQIKKTEALFTSQWGKFIEQLVRTDAVRLFQARGIPVRRLFPRAKSQWNGDSMEIDLLLENDDTAIVIEVKSTLKVDNVRDFLAKMQQFLTFFPRYRTYRVYGGVAGLDIVEEADKFAYRQGLFVLGMIGEGPIKIVNDAAFQPKDFCRME